jgi:hypothetical protein
MTQPTSSPDAPDEIDRAFSDYFKGQLPSSWPACRATAAVEPAKRVPDRDATWASRATLVASVALLLGVGFYFAGNVMPTGPTAPGKGGRFDDATANGTELLKSAGPSGKIDDPMKGIPPMPMP